MGSATSVVDEGETGAGGCLQASWGELRDYRPILPIASLIEVGASVVCHSASAAFRLPHRAHRDDASTSNECISIKLEYWYTSIELFQDTGRRFM